jgi:hypothetical protein
MIGWEEDVIFDSESNSEKKTLLLSAVKSKNL